MICFGVSGWVVPASRIVLVSVLSWLGGLLSLGWLFLGCWGLCIKGYFYRLLLVVSMVFYWGVFKGLGAVFYGLFFRF